MYISISTPNPEYCKNFSTHVGNNEVWLILSVILTFFFWTLLVILSSFNEMTLLLKVIGWCDVKHIMTLQIKTIMSVLKVSTDFQTRLQYCDNVCLNHQNCQYSVYIWLFFTGQLYIQESDVHIVRCCGLIASWQFYARRTGTLYFIVWRKTGKDFNNTRNVVGVNTISVSSK